MYDSIKNKLLFLGHRSSFYFWKMLTKTNQFDNKYFMFENTPTRTDDT